MRRAIGLALWSFGLSMSCSLVWLSLRRRIHWTWRQPLTLLIGQCSTAVGLVVWHGWSWVSALFQIVAITVFALVTYRAWVYDYEIEQQQQSEQHE